MQASLPSLFCSNPMNSLTSTVQTESAESPAEGRLFNWNEEDLSDLFSASELAEGGRDPMAWYSFEQVEVVS